MVAKRTKEVKKDIKAVIKKPEMVQKTEPTPSVEIKEEKKAEAAEKKPSFMEENQAKIIGLLCILASALILYGLISFVPGYINLFIKGLLGAVGFGMIAMIVFGLLLIIYG